MSNKANVSRKSNLSQETSTRSRDDRKRTSTSKKEDEKKSNGTSSKKKIESTVIKDPIKSSSGNSGRAERSINKNLNPTSSKNLNLHKSSSSKTQGTIANGVKSKLIKHSNDEKRGLSTIYMPSKKIHSTSKQNSEYSNKSNVTNKDSTGTGTKLNTSKTRMPSRERKKSRTLSPSEVKMLNRNVNLDISGPVASKREPSPEYEYEDDFEDYESDFQECTDSEASQVSDESESASLDEEEPVELQPAQKNDKLVANVILPRKYVEEEHMLDSGHYELQEARRRAARIDLMSGNRSINLVNNPQVIQRPIIYSDEKPSEIKSLPSSADEGFEDGRSGDFAKSPLIPGSFESGNQSDKKKTISRRLARGKEILQMIKLDVVEWSLFECTPIAYEEFIRIYGKINTRQISTQTNEDSLSVDVQTDDIECRNMWTQFPVVCRSQLKTSEDIKLFTRELIGVGGDDDELTERPHHDILQLNEFLSNAGKLMLALLEGKSSYVSSLDSNEIPMPFSDATIKLSVANVTFLSNRPVTMIRYSDISSRILITIHEPADEDIETAANEYVTDCCIGCQWNIGEPSRPTKIFYSSSNISACCFHPTNNNIIFAGLEDGSMSLWDLGEDEYYHRKIFDSDNKLGWIVRSPTFNTGGNFDDRTSSSSKIVALSILSKVESDSTDVRKFMPIQICSLDEDGSCVVWSVFKNFQGAASNDLGQSWWGKLRLVKSHEIPLHLEKHFKLNNIRGFRDIKIDSVNVNSLYVASNVNKVLHATRIGKKPQPFAYNGNDCTGGMTCIENCPFNLPFFLAGCEDGTVCLYSSTIERPLLKFKNLNTTAAIKIIQWSRSKPLTIFILDNDSCIHVWDLSKSDIFPTHSISPGKYSHVDSMELSPCKSNNDFINQYMALGLNNGNVEIHKFNKEFQYSDKNEISTELKVLINYLSIC